MYMLSCLLVCASLVLLLYIHEQNFSVILLCLCLVILFSLCGSFCHLTTSCVCRLHSSNVQTREGIASAISSCKGLTELSGLWDLDEDSMMMLMPIAPRLTKLDLTYASLGETQLSTLISSCTNLIDLKVRNGFHSVLCFQGDKIKFCYCFFFPFFLCSRIVVCKSLSRFSNWVGFAFQTFRQACFFTCQIYSETSFCVDCF
jgi:hypothetical protein